MGARRCFRPADRRTEEERKAQFRDARLVRNGSRNYNERRVDIDRSAREGDRGRWKGADHETDRHGA